MDKVREKTWKNSAQLMMTHIIYYFNILKIILQVGTVTIIMYVLDRFSPYGYRAEAKDTGEGDGSEFSMSNSLWFATGSILQQGADTTPKAGSGRVLAAAFWLFTLILISTYTANLAAYFTGITK